MNMHPLFDYVVIKPLESEDKLPSGILLPDSAKEKSQTGEVMAIGPGMPKEQTHTGVYGEGGSPFSLMVVKVGDHVIYKKWGGNEVKVNGEEWTIVEQKDVLAIVG